MESKKPYDWRTHIMTVLRELGERLSEVEAFVAKAKAEAEGSNDVPAK